jgi:aldose 1-epimerase
VWGDALGAPEVKVSDYGVTADGRAVHVYTLTNDHAVSAKILDYGGIIAELNAPDRQGRIKNVVLGLGDLKTYEANGGLNSLIGRYANRIKGGFSIDGHHYDLPGNPRGITLHSGRPFYGALVWEAGHPVRDADRAGVTLSHLSPDGEQGFPGTMHIEVTYTLNEANELRLDYQATTDKPTVVTLTNHVYFNLAGNGSGDVYGQQLQVLADQYTPTDVDQIPTGELAPVAGTALDFRELTPIGAHIRSSEQQMLYARGYDHNFVLRRSGDPLPLAARMYDPASGRLLELHTTEPGLQIYSANHMNGTVVSAVGTTMRQGDGMALETEHFPNSPNEPRFPTTLLRPGETLRSSTVFHMTTDVAQRLRH